MNNQTTSQQLFGSMANCLAKFYSPRIRVILSQGLDVNATNEYGQTPLMFAASFGNRDAIEILIQEGADISQKDHEELSVMHYACMYSNGIDCRTIELLHARGAALNDQGKDGNTPIYWVFYYLFRDLSDGSKTATYLLNQDVDPFIKNNMGQSTIDFIRKMEQNYPQEYKRLITQELDHALERAKSQRDQSLLNKQTLPIVSSVFSRRI